MIITIPTAQLCIKSDAPQAVLYFCYAVLNFFEKIKEPVLLVNDFKVRGPPGSAHLSYKESVFRDVLLVA